MSHFQTDQTVEDTQKRNISLINSSYPDWLECSDFTIPPPPLPPLPPPQQQQVPPNQDQAAEPCRQKPTPLNLVSNDTTWEYEHYAGCYACQTHESTPISCCNRLVLDPSPNQNIPQFVLPMLPVCPPIPTPQRHPASFLLFSPMPPTTPFQHLTPALQPGMCKMIFFWKYEKKTKSLGTLSCFFFAGTPAMVFQYPSPLIPPSPMMGPAQTVFVFPNNGEAQTSNHRLQ